MNDTCRIDDCVKPINHKRNQLCKMHQSRLDRHGHTNLTRRPAVKKPCAIDDCTNLTRSGSADLCPMHYHRQYRHGDVTMTAVGAPITASQGRRYRHVSATSHPMSNNHGIAYEHRVVLYDHIGEGPHHCHWCETEVHWKPTDDQTALHVDHLDGDGANNHPANLVPACRTCNSGRAAQERARALRAAGWWSVNDTVGKLGTRRTPIDPART